jgi:Fic family protein
MQVVSGQIDRPKIHFEAPNSSMVLNEMDDFLQWMKNSDLPPLIKSSIAHMYFISIHPFEDGNGRIVRAICEYILSNSLSKPSFTTLSRQIEKQRKEYYDILEKSNKAMNIEAFIEWFCVAILDAQKYALSLINFTIQKTKLLDRLR